MVKFRHGNPPQLKEWVNSNACDFIFSQDQICLHKVSLKLYEIWQYGAHVQINTYSHSLCFMGFWFEKNLIVCKLKAFLSVNKALHAIHYSMGTIFKFKHWTSFSARWKGTVHTLKHRDSQYPIDPLALYNSLWCVELLLLRLAEKRRHMIVDAHDPLQKGCQEIPTHPWYPYRQTRKDCQVDALKNAHILNLGVFRAPS